MKFSSNQFLRIIQMRTRFAIEQFCLWLCTLLILITTFSTSIIAIFLKYPIFHWNSFFFYEKIICFSVPYQQLADEREEQKISPHKQHWFKWMKKTGKRQQRLKNYFDEHEINKSCRSSCQMPWMIRFSSNDFNQLLFSSIFFPIETMNQPF